MRDQPKGTNWLIIIAIGLIVVVALASDIAAVATHHQTIALITHVVLVR